MRFGLALVRRLQFEAVALQLAGETAVRREKWDEAGLDGVVDIRTSFEDARYGIERAVELGLPAMRPIDHMGREKAPDAPVPFLINRVGATEPRAAAAPIPSAKGHQ